MLKMVIADDEAIICESIAKLIDWNSIGVKISAICKNGVDALDAIIDTCPDIVLTDIRMPGLNGLKLIEKIRLADHDIQIIILTGYKDFEAAKTAMQHSVKYYLLKPINSSQLVETVEKAKKDCMESAALFKLKLEASQPRQSFSLGPINKAADRLILCERDSFAREAIESFLDGMHDIEQLRVYGAELLSRLHQKKSSSWNWRGAFDSIYTEQDFSGLRKGIESMAMDLLFPKQSDSTAVGKVKEYIESHIADGNISLKWLAANRLYMNADHLSRLFVTETGEKFSSYLNRIRMERAKELLSAYGVSRISDVAELVGCGNNPRYFSQIFKKYTGLTPSAYIAQLKPNDHE
ncbi:MAG: response regulator [Clostridiales bacterium]|nr:response regulator [Clostridiales bacterium]